MMPNLAVGGGRTKRRPPQLGMPQRKTGGAPDLNGAERGMGYHGALNPNSPNFGNRQASGGSSIFDQFNAWQDPNIGGQQPGPIQAGYGGFSSLDTMGGTKMNDFLNTMPVGGQREQAMNQLGYFNGGNPFTPQVPRGTNRGFRAQAQGNQQSGAYSAPGIYQHMGQGQTDANGSPILNSYGGYTGITNVDQSGAAQYTPFDVNARGGRTRRTRTFGQVRY